MCGRYTLTSDGQTIADAFEIAEPVALSPRYNIAPTQVVATVRADESGARHVHEARWGLVPPGAKELRVGARMINARSETVHRLPAFRRPFRKRRCIVPASGWVEWTKNGKMKDPWLFCRADGRPLGFAGIWETWRGPEEQVVETYSILTRDAVDWAAHIHDRMPVVLAPEDYATWLAPRVQEPEVLQAFFQGFPLPTLDIVPISHRINKVQNDDEACLEVRAVQPQLL